MFDIEPDAVEIAIVTDDVIVIIAVPEALIVWLPTKRANAVAITNGGYGLEPLHDVTERWTQRAVRPRLLTSRTSSALAHQTSSTRLHSNMTCHCTSAPVP